MAGSAGAGLAFLDSGLTAVFLKVFLRFFSILLFFFVVFFLGVFGMQNLSRFELARLISARALQLALGAPPLVKPSASETVIDVAERELEKKVLPLSVLRSYPDGRTERL